MPSTRPDAVSDRGAEPVAVRRVAGLRLRGAGGPVRARVAWPDSRTGGGPPALLVFVPDGPRSFDGVEWADALCSRAGVVALSPSYRDDPLHDATTALEWAAEHAGELDADARRLVVAGGTLAAVLALHVRDQGWPALARQLLIHRVLETRSPLRAATLAGLAPATVVTASDGSRRYAARLRGAGVEVEELRDEAARPERILADVARSLRLAVSAGGRTERR